MDVGKMLKNPLLARSKTKKNLTAKMGNFNLIQKRKKIKKTLNHLVIILPASSLAKQILPHKISRSLLLFFIVVSIILLIILKVLQMTLSARKA